MANVQDEIRSRVDEFVSELTTLVRKSALEALGAALSGSMAPAHAAAPRQALPPARRPVGRPRKVALPTPAPAAAKPAAKPAAPAAKPAAAKPAAAPAPAAAKPSVSSSAAAAAARQRARAKGEKRKPEELKQTVSRLFDHIKAHPNQGIEAIGKALAIPTKDLTLPIKKLLGEKRITSEGEKRATKYAAAR